MLWPRLMLLFDFIFVDVPWDPIVINGVKKTLVNGIYQPQPCVDALHHLHCPGHTLGDEILGS